MRIPHEMGKEIVTLHSEVHFFCLFVCFKTWYLCVAILTVLELAL